MTLDLCFIANLFNIIIICTLFTTNFIMCCNVKNHNQWLIYIDYMCIYLFVSITNNYNNKCVPPVWYTFDKQKSKCTDIVAIL